MKFFTWRQAGGLQECPYFHRTIFNFGFFTIRIHEWHSDDDHRAYHDHPYWFWTLVLRGGYTDVCPISQVYTGSKELSTDYPVHDDLTIGSIRFRKAEYRHSVQFVKPNTITLLITGPAKRRWGFWVDGKLIKRDKYFATMGHHPCDNIGKPVRIKPNGDRV